MNRIKELRTALGLSQEDVAKQANTSKDQISKLERGQRQLTDQWMRRLAPVLKCRPQDVISGGAATVKVVGFVGAGAEVHFFDDHQPGDGLEEVECPPGLNPEIACAWKVCGDSMVPMMYDGWLIFTEERMVLTEGPLRTVPYLVRCIDGRTFVKMLRPGRDAGTFDLLSHNSPVAIESVKLEWAAKIRDIRPR